MRYRGPGDHGADGGALILTQTTPRPHTAATGCLVPGHGQGFTFYDSQVLVQELPWASQGYFQKISELFLKLKQTAGSSMSAVT